MTHNDIYTKFLIEYDKANVTSSYPSLTEFEAATLLDRAYNTLLAQKVTGNNVRKSYIETDLKAISDLQPLVTHKDLQFKDPENNYVSNMSKFDLPEDFNYFIQACVNYNTGESVEPYDNVKNRIVPMKLISHQMCENFFATPYNMPWIKIPVCYIEDNSVFVLYDKLNAPMVNTGDVAHLTYIKTPKSFVKSLIKTEISENTEDTTDDPSIETPESQKSKFTLNISKLNSPDIID